MRAAVGLVLLFIALPLSANAQDLHHYELAGGYSHMAAEGDGLPGWFASFAWKRDRWHGVVVDLSGHSLDMSSENSSRNVHLTSGHIGLRVFISTKSRITPFFHGLLGFSAVPVEEKNRALLGDTNPLGSGAVGLGVDLRASEKVALRLIQFDYIAIESGRIKRKRLSTAIVFRF
jgi:hypothetical protein